MYMAAAAPTQSEKIASLERNEQSCLCQLSIDCVLWHGILYVLLIIIVSEFYLNSDDPALLDVTSNTMHVLVHKLLLVVPCI